jgi:hypothetical protein
MLANGGDAEGLFHGAFMQSGSPPNLGDITRGQPVYDILVQETGCSGSGDTLECLRNVPASTFQAAIDMSPSVLSNEVGYLALRRMGGYLHQILSAAEFGLASKTGWCLLEGYAPEPCLTGKRSRCPFRDRYGWLLIVRFQGMLTLLRGNNDDEGT